MIIACSYDVRVKTSCGIGVETETDIQGVPGRIVNILGGGSMDYFK
jgi:hypothetical protein